MQVPIWELVIEKATFVLSLHTNAKRISLRMQTKKEQNQTFIQMSTVWILLKTKVFRGDFFFRSFLHFASIENKNCEKPIF